MVFTPEGASLTAGGIRQLLLENGFEEPRVDDLIAGMTKSLVAARPAG